MSVHLIGVYLTDVHLTGVHLISVHLTGVRLMGMHLIGIVRIRPCPSPMWATKRSNDFTSVKSLADYHICERP
jgi:hypothetical protein